MNLLKIGSPSCARRDGSVPLEAVARAIPLSDPIMRMRLLAVPLVCLLPLTVAAQRTHKPPLHGQQWMAITGKPLGATAGAKIFLQGGNAVDAACAMLASAVRAQRTRAHGLPADLWSTHDGSGQRYPHRPTISHLLGCLVQSWRGSRGRVVMVGT